jgi:starch synthase
MKILFASSEVFPFSKTGGLADVSSALPKALREKGVEVSIITPLYKNIDKNFALTPTDTVFSIPISSKVSEGRIFTGHLDNKVPVFFVDCKQYYNREELYTAKEGDYLDNAERFIFFSRLIVEFAIKEGYDILHINDWQTAMAAVYAKVLYNWEGKTVLTIHNLGYQGTFWHNDMHLTNLGWEYFTPKMIEFWGKINFLKGGIYFSDAITTVSPTYAKEILLEESGFGLNGVLRDVADKLCGIINGIDRNEWSPEKDRYIAKKYGVRDVTGQKKICKKDLLSVFGVNQEKKSPVFGMISRLADQKGWDLLAAAMEELIGRDLIFIILGTGEARYQEMLKALKQKYPEKVAVHLGFNDELAHKIEAGSDFFVMPSRYEPCGLNQMISMGYGTIPVVRGVGGLDDTVVDIEDTKEGTGIKFYDYTKDALVNSIDRALDLYRAPLKLARIRKSCMKKDFSWGASAEEYLSLYKKIVG